jgi:aryl-alcohol dehydrogenase-like predicted oxidoreductase
VDDEYLYRVLEAIDLVAKQTGRSVPQIALNWLFRKPTVCSVIIGALSEEQLRQSLSAVDFKLTEQQVEALDAASTKVVPYPYWHQHQFRVRNPPAAYAQ